MPTINPFYFNPFFRRCNQFFRKNKKIFPGNQECFQNPAHKTPESGKKRRKESAQGPVGQKTARTQGQKESQPQISAADPEGQIHPAPAEAQQKNQICQSGQPGPEGLQKTVKKPQTHPQTQSTEGVGGGKGRGHQGRKRPRMPRLRGSWKIRAEICPSTAASPPSRERFFSCRP